MRQEERSRSRLARTTALRALGLALVLGVPRLGLALEPVWEQSPLGSGDFNPHVVAAAGYGFWISGAANDDGAIVRYSASGVAPLVHQVPLVTYELLEGLWDGGVLSARLERERDGDARCTLRRFDGSGHLDWTTRTAGYACVRLAVDESGAAWLLTGATNGDVDRVFRVGSDGVARELASWRAVVDLDQPSASVAIPDRGVVLVGEDVETGVGASTLLRADNTIVWTHRSGLESASYFDGVLSGDGSIVLVGRVAASDLREARPDWWSPSRRQDC